MGVARGEVAEEGVGLEGVEKRYGAGIGTLDPVFMESRAANLEVRAGIEAGRGAGIAGDC